MVNRRITNTAHQRRLVEPAPLATSLELHADIASFNPDRPVVHEDLNDAIDLSLFGRSTGQPVRQAMLAGWAYEVADQPTLTTIVQAWAEMCPDWGYIDPDDGIAFLARRLTSTSPT